MRPLYPIILSLFFTASICQAQGSSTERDVTLNAADGTALKASYFPAAKPGPGVLLLHQCNRQRKVWDGLAQQLAAAGINVLTLDLRGFGESGGEPQDKLPPGKAGQIAAQLWPGDIDVAFQYLGTQPGVTRDTIGVGGASCGVNNSVQTARRHPEVRSLVLMSGNTDFSGRRYLRNSSDVPVFFAVADDDEFKPTVDLVEWLYTLTPNSEKKMIHYSTGGHGADMFRVHPELEELIVNWYVTTLIKTPGHAPVPADAPVIPETVRNIDVIDQPGGSAKMMQELNEARKKDPKAILFREDMVNFLGYDHAQSGDIKGAIEIMKLNVAAFPNSPNVYDSLSDVYLADGQKDPARENAKKALELLATDTTDDEQLRNGVRANAEQKLKQLGDASK
jgi:dienelactone hydrolase